MKKKDAHPLHFYSTFIVLKVLSKARKNPERLGRNKTVFAEDIIIYEGKLVEHAII